MAADFRSVGLLLRLTLRKKRPYFPVIGLNTEIFGVNLHIQSKYRKIWTRKTPHLDTFHAV